MSRRLNITVLVDRWTVPNDDPEFRTRPQVPTTEYHVIQTLRELHYDVSVLPAEDDIAGIVTNLAQQEPDLIFNLTEQLRGDRTMDKNIAAVLEITGIPFTGAGPTGLMLCRDKGLCKQLLTLHRIRVPNFVHLPHNRKFRMPKNLRYPLVVKPALEDSSEGISNASLVGNEASLAERVRFVHQGWQQPAIAEEYIRGRELYIGILGNRRLTVLPPRECRFNFDGDQGPFMATYRVKWNAEYRKKWNIEFGFAELDDPVFRRIDRLCKRVYRVLQMRDYVLIVARPGSAFIFHFLLFGPSLLH